ncbi:MAG: Imidazoleglycerol-phosphate dehydratase [Candidatus Magnetoglobus multicellularis str. Araruama]|uniref:Imidazoleglycerol-phosphate dehydratase n=1 Tax=Candidatus Magnetoglobus multicellularis str. Araruama TaxID=890399 RepID=A0A1V1PHA4_9BACT|nr:MAG: Imidazoleglycerol-phosphate dehydratase [Candidatus Magnetoglobus multicellularis str. Araruama]
MRNSLQNRKTNETNIQLKYCLDGSGTRNIQSGIGFLDHMLELFTFHGRFDLDINCQGDLDICPHHTIEDIAIVLGQAIDDALGDRKSITRYACCYLPMDECLSRTVIDVSGRPYHMFNAHFQTPMIGTCPTEMIPHFFYSLTMNARMTIHQEILYGQNDHHKAESLFKGLGRALHQSVQLDQSCMPSTKGLI